MGEPSECEKASQSVWNAKQKRWKQFGGGGLSTDCFASWLILCVCGGGGGEPTFIPFHKMMLRFIADLDVKPQLHLSKDAFQNQVRTQVPLKPREFALK